MDSIIPLLTLIALEVILGIDNIIFIAILADKLPPDQRKRLRYWGIGLALIIRLLLLGAIAWILKLDQTIFTLFNTEFSGKGIILILGGIFLLYKSTKEIFEKTEIEDMHAQGQPHIPKKVNFKQMVIEVIILDLVFSIDSIITAVGMVDELWIMYTAVIVAVTTMLFASKPINDFVNKHPSFKILALCFLMMIGVTLIAEGIHFEIPKSYIYTSMAFAFLVNVIQIRNLSHKK
jgi:predicted tellurium resistance membrane protein TerC